jgi:4-hydroxybenzoyl-CoA reductase subunit beta
MHLPAHEFLKPDSLEASLAALRAARGEVRLLAGGTDVIFNMRGRLFQPDVLLSIRNLPELQGVTESPDGGLRLGAGSRLTDLERDPRVARFPLLRSAFRAVASRHVRNMATLGGNLCLDTRCWYTNQTAEWRAAKGPCLKMGVDACHAIRTSPVCVALHASDTAPALIALDASVTLQNADGTRQVPLADFYTGDGVVHTVRRADEILTAVTVPPTSDRSVFIKETARKGNDFSYGVIAARADGQGQHVSRLQIVLGCLTTRPVSLDQPVRIVLRDGFGDASITAAAAAVRDELGALTNLYTPAAYKATLARMLVTNALRALREGPHA